MILPAIGDRLICTSNGERKILTRVGELISSGVKRLIRVTRPSAGETMTSGSDGGILLGSRKKKAINSAIKRKNAPTYQSPRANDPIVRIVGTTTNGMLSLTMPK